MKNLVSTQKSKTYYVFAILFLLFLSACKNDKRIISISGIIEDPSLEIILEGVEVALYTQKAETGTFSYNFQKQATTISDKNGEFSFEFEFSYNIAFKLELSKDLYFSSSSKFEIEELTDDDKYFNNFDLFPQAWIHFHIVDENPFNNHDMVMYRIENFDLQCNGCCPNEFISFEGYTIDETFECLVYGNREYTINFITRKNEVETFPVRVVYCPAFETKNVELIF
ncbi:MAG: hypothetical protein U9R19_00295 [Bacteroidota bacterium]|nr:hypothetical protein [Bacteroidota bacterium]